MSGPFLALVVGVPLLHFILLKKRKNAPYMEFVTHNFRPGYEMYEILFFCRRLMLALAFGLVPKGVLSLVVIVICVLFVSTVLVWSPFHNKAETYMDAASISVVAITHSQIAAVAQGKSVTAVLAITAIMNIGFFIVVSCILVYSLIQALRGVKIAQVLSNSPISWH